VGDPLVCARSPINYPSLVAAALDVSAFVDRTCGSASFDDLAAVQKVGFFGLPLGTAPPQFDALDESVELITIGMGGNDIGLPDFAVGCLNVVPIRSVRPRSAVPARRPSSPTASTRRRRRS
jgi:hypothetical protein